MRLIARLLLLLPLSFAAFDAEAETVLPANRMLNFDDYGKTNNPVTWAHEGPLPAGTAAAIKALLMGTNHYHATGWSLLSCRAGSSAYLGYSVPPIRPSVVPIYPATASNLTANLRNETAALIESPVLTNGIGTVYFEAINNQAGAPVQLAVEISTNMADVISGEVVRTLLPPESTNLTNVWETLDVLGLNAVISNDFTRYSRQLNVRSPAKVRLRRTGEPVAGYSPDAAFLVVDNLRVSPPPCGVEVSDMRAYMSGAKVRIECGVGNADTNSPTESRTVVAFYRYLDLEPPHNGWTNAPLERSDPGDGCGNGERYGGDLPEQPQGGLLEYRVHCLFTGYAYQSPDFTGAGYAYASESLSPALTSAQTQTLSGATFYTLSVLNGSGSGGYTNGARAAISAHTLEGQVFVCWTGATEYVEDRFAQTTAVTIPSHHISIAATYSNAYYQLTVTGGSGSGDYANGQVVAISAAAPPAGKIFDRWTGDIAFVACATCAVTTVTMAAPSIALTAAYLDLFTLTVSGGSGGGTYTSGQRVAIAANPPAPGWAFDQWTGATPFVDDARAPSTVVSMPASDIALSALYSNVYYQLTVIGGSGSGAYTNGQLIAIAATVPENKTFVRWTGDTTAVANSSEPNTTVAMPAANVTLTALTSSSTTALPDSRYLHFNDYAASNTAELADQPWILHEGPRVPGIVNPARALLWGTNHYHRSGWKLLNCRAGTCGAYSGARIIPPVVTIPTFPAIASNLAANLRNDLGALIESPVFTNGIGTVYFEAINEYVEYPTEIMIEIATNMVDLATAGIVGTLLPPSTNNLEYVWQALSVLSLNAATANDFVRYRKTINYRGSAKLRIRRAGSTYSVSSLDTALTVVDNIRVSPPPSDVELSLSATPFSPCYPFAGTNLTVRCQVSNLDAFAPTDARTLRVVYRWRYLTQSVGPWTTNMMSYVAGTGDGQGNGEQYQATLSASPFSEAGDLEYYFVCEQEGYLYQSPDYTGIGYVYPSESVSPKLLRGDGEGREFAERLRPHASRFRALYAEVDQLADPVPMGLVGDHEWRALVPLSGIGTNLLTWRFKAEGEVDTVSGAPSQGVTYWAGTNSQTRTRLPCLGTCSSTGPEARLAVRTDEGHYVALTLHTETLQYSAVRAEQQNFNVWPAPENAFTDSYGQEAKRRFTATFDDWPASVAPTVTQAFAGLPPVTNVFQSGAFLTLPPAFVAGDAAYACERTLVDNTANAPAGAVAFRNVALRLKGGDGALGRGYLHSRAATLSNGLKELFFRARTAQSADNYDICYYRNGFTNLNYAVKATARALSTNSLSPQHPSISLIGYYQDAENFYEYRVTQTNDVQDKAGSISDRAIKLGLYKWKNGVSTLVTGWHLYNSATAPLLSPSISDASPLEISFYNEESATRIKCRYKNNDIINYLDVSSPHTGGTFGYLSSDCGSSLSYVRTQATITGATGNGPETVVLRQDGNFSYDVQFWFLPSKRYQARSDSLPKGIYSLVPTAQLGVYVQPAVFDSPNEPEGPESAAWERLVTVSVSNFAYEAFSLPVHSSQSRHVMLKMQGGSEDIVVDELSYAAWRGKSNGPGSGDPSEWVATESWVVSNATAAAHTLHLDHSRSVLTEDQALRSPLMETGRGMIEFDYRVLRGPAKLIAQVSRPEEPDAWQEVGAITATNASEWKHGWADLGSTEPGYFRLLNAREGVYTNAWVELNNVVAWDEPAFSNAWRAYNAKITSTDTNRVALDESKACFLNNSQLQEASPPQTAFEPFLLSPELPRGLGRISFFARAYTNGQPATLFLYASTNGWNAPANRWFEISRFENITNGLYKRLSYEPEDGRAYNAVKLETGTSASARRVCLDEVVITEPVFASFDIQDVQLLRRSGDEVYEHHQPLEGEDIDVQARLANEQLAPSNVTFYLSYYLGTNTWGVDRWPAEETVTRRMLPVEGDATLYRTVPAGDPRVPAGEAGGIPGQARDRVVQYVVWASYEGGVDLKVRQATFENPPWYYGVDLNAWYGSSGWSPYYIVFASDERAAPPLFSAADGTVFTNQAVIELSSATVGAAIHYTIDGIEPTAASPLYSAPLILDESATIRARAFLQGLLESAEATAHYTVLQTVETPSLSPTNGTCFAASRKVTLSCGTAGADIRVTLDGAEPTEQSSLYAGAFNVYQTVTVKARAFKAGMVASAVVSATYFRLPSPGDALDNPALAVSTGGDAAWFVQTNVTHDGVDAMQSGAITDGQQSWMQATVTGPAALSFWWKASCENDPDGAGWDYACFSVDGVEQCRLDGITGWQQASCMLSNGVHTLRWEYRKDESLSEGQDCAWVDQLVIAQENCTASTPVPVPFLWLDQYPGLLGTAGGDYEAAAQADADGDGHAAWQEYITGSIPTNRESVLRTRIGVSNGVARISWTPDLGTARVYTVSGCSNLTERTWGGTNGSTRFFRVRVSLPE